MCGIAGLIEKNCTSFKREETLANMLKTIGHRGPDNAGQAVIDEFGCSFGHVRLSIQDLSLNGAQPMVNDKNSWILTFNGEIYNHLELRASLNEEFMIRWNGSSDTETLVNALDKWGIEKTLDRLDGMFAFAAIDRVNGKLYLARDRFGEKPLYYSVGRQIAFASQLQCFEVIDDLKLTISSYAMNEYFSFGYINSNRTIYNEIEKVAPASYIEFDLKDESYDSRIISYWEKSKTDLSLNEDELINRVHNQIRHAVKSCLISDLPVGAFLSGGIDSSLICAIYREVSNTNINTYSIGFENKNFDETKFANSIANKLGTNHRTYIINDIDVKTLVPNIVNFWDEPFFDASQIPTQIVSKLAKNDVTVILSGDGGDELFCGYTRYFVAEGLEKKLGLILRKKLFRKCAIFLIEKGIVKSIFEKFPKRLKPSNLDGKIEKLISLLSNYNSGSLYANMMKVNSDFTFLQQSFQELVAQCPLQHGLTDEADLKRQYMNHDVANYLPNDILKKVDIASMSVSLEARVPFLTKGMAEMAMSIPTSLHTNYGRTGKYILKSILARYIGWELIERPKMGFGVPMADWLRHPLRDWTEEIINNLDEGIFSKEKVKNLYLEHSNGTHDHSNKIWSIIIFQNWLNNRNLSHADIV